MLFFTYIAYVFAHSCEVSLLFTTHAYNKQLIETKWVSIRDFGVYWNSIALKPPPANS